MGGKKLTFHFNSLKTWRKIWRRSLNTILFFYGNSLNFGFKRGTCKKQAFQFTENWLFPHNFLKDFVNFFILWLSTKSILLEFTYAEFTSKSVEYFLYLTFKLVNLCVDVTFAVIFCQGYFVKRILQFVRTKRGSFPLGRF